MILLLTILSLTTILDAFGDAMRFMGKQIIHHIAEASVIALWIAGAWFLREVSDYEFLWLIIYMICFRMIVFDQLFNVFAGLPFFHVGNSSLWDKLMQKGGSILKVMAVATLAAAIIRLTT